MCKDKTKGFNLLFLVPRIRRFTLAYLESLFTDFLHVQTNRSLVSWMGEGKRAFKAGFCRRRNLESSERL